MTRARNHRVLGAIVFGIVLLMFQDCAAQSRATPANQDVRDGLRRLEENQQAFQRQLTEVRVAVAERFADKESTARLFDATNKSIDRLQTTLMFALGFLAVIAIGAIAGAVSLNTLKAEVGVVRAELGVMKTELGAVEGLLKNLYERLGERYPRTEPT